jgi:predicted nucleotidyltransferase
VTDATFDARVAALIAARSDVDLAVVFGSVARGESGPSSDLDLAVRGSVDRLTLGADLALSLGCDVDVVPLDTDDIVLLQELVRDGRLLFERVPGSYATFRAHSLASLETDLPWLRLQQRAFVERLASGSKAR